MYRVFHELHVSISYLRSIREGPSVDYVWLHSRCKVSGIKQGDVQCCTRPSPHLIFAASDAVVVVCPVVQQDYVLRARLDTPQFHGLACEIIRKNLCLRIVQSDQIARDFGFPGDGSKIEIGLKSG